MEYEAKTVDFKKEGDIGDAFVSRQIMMKEGHPKDNYLTYIELGITNACNLNCVHCGVYELPIYATKVTGGKKVDAVIKALDELDTLRLLSITGGEPLMSPYYVDNIILPILEFANSKKIISQINTNLVIPRQTLKMLVKKVSIIHTSFNYTNEENFGRIAFASKADKKRIHASYQQLLENIKFLVKEGSCITVETMLFFETIEHFAEINHLVADLGVARQEIQPPFPSNNELFKVPTLEELLFYMNKFLDERNQNFLVQLDCAPFYWCNGNNQVVALLERMEQEPNLVTRVCPDGRSRFNLNLDGEVRVTDFSELLPIGSIHDKSLMEIYEEWRNSDLYQKYNCECEEHRCLGPCILVANTYYPQWQPGK